MDASSIRHVLSILAPVSRGYARLQAVPLRRAFWLLMGLAHAPALISAWRSLVAGGFAAESFGGCVLLTLSMLFFALKLRDVPYLRFRTDRRSCVALCIVVALLHTDAIVSDDNPTVIPECTALVVTTWLSTQLPLTRRMSALLPTRVVSVLGHGDPVTSATGTVWLGASRPHCWVLGLHVFSLRAPPA